MNKKEIEQKHRYFCQRGIEEIDYKNINSISKGISSFKKILPRQKKGICVKHQRKLACAIKRARFMALIPYIR